MYKRTLVGLCAALAFAAGSTAVHAVKIVPDDQRQRRMTQPWTASPTLRKRC